MLPLRTSVWWYVNTLLGFWPDFVVDNGYPPLKTFVLENALLGLGNHDQVTCKATSDVIERPCCCCCTCCCYCSFHSKHSVGVIVINNGRQRDNERMESSVATGIRAVRINIGC